MATGEPHPLIVELRALRQRAGMKQAVHAAYADVSATALSHYESGRRRPTLAALERLCSVLGCRLVIEEVPGVPRSRSRDPGRAKGGVRARGTDSAAPDGMRARRTE